jgi:hypothetical protein
MFKKYKNIILIIVIAVVIFFVYTKFFSSSDQQSNDLLLVAGSGRAVEEVATGREFLSILLELRSLRLDESIFEDELFLVLKDFSQEVSPQPAGRPNPFLNIGVDLVVSDGDGDDEDLEEGNE